MRLPLLICDLDGTLVDSKPGIVQAIREACAACGIEPIVPLEGTLVGPPLDGLLRHVTGVAEGKVLDQLRARFTEAYDGWAYRQTVPYQGVQSMLASLLANGIRLALATNKRQKPTSLILDALGWHDHFDVVEAVDSRPPSPRSKAQMLRDILAAFEPTIAAYLGDTAADVEAASDASLPCILAGWGCRGPQADSKTTVAAFPSDVIAAFAKSVDR